MDNLIFLIFFNHQKYKIKSNRLNYSYYLQVFSNHHNLITVFILIDLKEQKVYFGEDKISDSFYPLKQKEGINLNKAIPISKTLFISFLDLSLKDLNKINKNIFLAFNGLEEWII